jgi:hypothetical protein
LDSAQRCCVLNEPVARQHGRPCKTKRLLGLLVSYRPLARDFLRVGTLALWENPHALSNGGVENYVSPRGSDEPSRRAASRPPVAHPRPPLPRRPRPLPPPRPRPRPRPVALRFGCGGGGGGTCRPNGRFASDGAGGGGTIVKRAGGGGTMYRAGDGPYGGAVGAWPRGGARPPRERGTGGYAAAPSLERRTTVRPLASRTTGVPKTGGTAASIATSTASASIASFAPHQSGAVGEPSSRSDRAFVGNKAAADRPGIKQASAATGEMGGLETHGVPGVAHALTTSPTAGLARNA